MHYLKKYINGRRSHRRDQMVHPQEQDQVNSIRESMEGALKKLSYIDTTFIYANKDLLYVTFKFLSCSKTEIQ